VRHAFVITCLVTLSTALISISFVSGKRGDAITFNSERSILAHAPGSSFAVAGDPGNVVIGDMNKDGKLDLIVAGGKSRSISVLPGLGDGRFGAPLSQPLITPESPGAMELGDLNDDGKLDLAFITHDSYGVTILLGDGKNGLRVAPNSPIVMKDGRHPHTHGLVLGDLNGDGKLDLATVNNADNDISIAFGDGRGLFTRAPSTFAVGPSPYPAALGDVNNDGHPDIVATTSATGPQRAQQLPFSRALTLLLNDGHGSFRASQLPLRTGQPWFVAIGDVNGDHHADLVATHHDQQQLTVLLGNGKGGFGETSASPFDFGHSVFSVALVDMNRDSKADVIGVSGVGVRIMLGDGRGGFKPAPDSPFLTDGGTWSFAIGDVNGDGKTDVVTTSSESGKLSVLLGQ
jgi:VCBS repeat protein/FG-GAP repeat protein